MREASKLPAGLGPTEDARRQRSRTLASTRGRADVRVPTDNARLAGNAHLRPILVAPIEDEERVGLAEEVLFVQLVGAELHGGDVLQDNNS